jgi:hypothetical protein
MGSLMKLVGGVWAAAGFVATMYGVFVSVPRIVADLTTLLSATPYGAGVDPDGVRLFLSTFMFVSGVNGFVIPGLLVAGVGTVIGLQRRPATLP